ncbi:hypothetical protein [Streptomyces sp. B21-083]|uniref:hypothetical protein n=1 Tax=Streptomyces sp. B21-083 TaxID=3039410 RepID=UPI002FF3F11B
MSGVAWAPVAKSASRGGREGTLESWCGQTRVDPLARLSAADEAELAAARDAWGRILAGRHVPEPHIHSTGCVGKTQPAVEYS